MILVRPDEAPDLIWQEYFSLPARPHLCGWTVRRSFYEKYTAYALPWDYFKRRKFYAWQRKWGLR